MLLILHSKQIPVNDAEGDCGYYISNGINVVYTYVVLIVIFLIDVATLIRLVYSLKVG